MEHESASKPAGLATRTVLPGEPFEAPMQSQVPGPRPAPIPETAQLPESAPQWNFGFPAHDDVAAQQAAHPGAPGFSAMNAPMGMQAASVSGDFETLEQFASLPMTPPAAGQAPLAAHPVPPAAFAPDAYAAAGFATRQAPWPTAPVPAPTAAMPEPTFPTADAMPGSEVPALPGDINDESKNGRRRSGHGANRKLIALAAVVVLGAGGYFGYSQFSKSDSSSSTSTPAANAPVTPPAGAATATPYAFPAHLAGFTLQTSAAAKAQNRQIRSFALGAYPNFAKSLSVASYSAGKPSIISMSFHPAASKRAAAYQQLIAGARKPAAGNVVGAFTAVTPGAAGGSMTCGDQRGASPIGYCIWQGTSTVGMLYVTGSSGTSIPQILTRELRAYAEH